MLLEDCRYLFTQDADRTVREHVDVRVADGRIAAVGDDLDAAGETVECSDAAVLPGLVNAHTHAAMTVLRGISDDKPLQPWLEEDIFPAEEQLDKAAVKAGTRHAIMEMLLSGTTCFNDMYAPEDPVAEAVDATGIRAVLGRGIMDLDGDTDAALQDSERFVAAWQGHDRVTPAVAPHAPYTCSTALLEAAMDQAERYDVPLHLHVAETQGDVADCRDAHGATPVRYLADHGLLDARTVAAHGVHLTDGDRAALADAGAGVAHNPAANLKLGSGVADVAALRDRGVPVGVGTDGVASNNSLDLWEEAKLAALLQKERDPAAVTAQDALDMVTRDAAAVLGLGDRIGTIEAGMAADMVAVPLDDPAMQPAATAEGVLSHLVYGFRGRVDTAVVAGEVLVRDGRPVGMDTDAVRTAVEDVRRGLG